MKVRPLFYMKFKVIFIQYLGFVFRNRFCQRVELLYLYLSRRSYSKNLWIFYINSILYVSKYDVILRAMSLRYCCWDKQFTKSIYYKKLKFKCLHFSSLILNRIVHTKCETQCEKLQNRFARKRLGLQKCAVVHWWKL